MKTRLSAWLLTAVLAVTASCSSPPTPQDRRPLGNVTDAQGECGTLSRQAISRATGMDDFYASGTNTLEHFGYCMVSKSADMSEPVMLSFEVHDPLPFSLGSVERRRVADKGTPLPSGVGPGYSAIIRGKDGEPSGAYVSAWTPDGTRLLSIRLYQGAPGRDHQADVIEFARQLRPALLPSK